MAKFTKIQNSFNSGELSEKLHGRTDLKEYAYGLAEMQNFFPVREGMAVKRPGSQFQFKAEDKFTLVSDSKVSIIPFVFSLEESYTVYLKPGDFNNIEVVAQDGTLATVNVTASTDIWDQNAPLSTGGLLTGRDELDPYGFQWVQSADSLFIVHESGWQPPVVLIRTAENTFVLDLYGYPEQIELGSNFYAGAAIPQYNRVPFQDANTSGISMTPSGTGGAITLTASSAYFTGTAAHWVGAIFEIEHVGSGTGYVRVTGHTSTTVVSAQVLSTLSAATATTAWAESSWNAVRGFPRSITLFEQRLYFGGTVFQPDTVFASKTGNIYFMRSEGADDNHAFNFTLASSQVNEIKWLIGGQNLQIGTLGAEYIATGGSNAITPSNITVTPQTSHGSSGVLPARTGQSTMFVSRDGRRVREMIYNDSTRSYIAQNISLLGEGLINHEFDPTSNFAGVKIVRIAYQESRGILWCLTSKKVLIGVSLDKDADMVGWHKHTIGGTDVEVNDIAVVPTGQGEYDELFLSITRTINSATTTYVEKIGNDFEHTLLKNSSTNIDDIPYYSDCASFFAVSDSYTNTFASGDIDTSTDEITVDLAHASGRLITTGTKVKLTTTGTLPSDLDTTTDYFIIKVDSTTAKLAATRGNALSGTAIDLTSTSGSGNHSFNIIDAVKWDGFDHLEGETLQVLGDGFRVDDEVVDSSGEITLSEPVTEIVAGLKYTSKIKLLPVEGGSQFGTAQGAFVALRDVILRLYKSYGGKLGSDENVLEELQFREDGSPFNQQLQLFTGDKEVNFSLSDDTIQRLQPIILHDEPLPFNMLAAILLGESRE